METLSETGSTMGTLLKSAVQTGATDTIGMFGEVLPIALSVFIAAWGVRKAIRFFKGAAN